MRGNELLDKMELVDAAYVEAADAEPMNVKLKKNRAVWMKWGAAAACVSLLAFGGMMADRKDDSARISLGGILREYKNTNITASELAIEWPWEYKTISEQYTTLVLNGEEFNAGRAIDASWIGDILGSYDVAGYDTYTGQEHHMTAEVYRIAGISEDKIVAVKLDGGFFGFRHMGYAPPADFGELLDDYTLEETLPLKQFTECEGYEEKGHFRLDDDAYIWEVLTACRSAAFINDDSFSENGRSLSCHVRGPRRLQSSVSCHGGRLCLDEYIRLCLYLSNRQGSRGKDFFLRCRKGNRIRTGAVHVLSCRYAHRNHGGVYFSG